MRLPLFPVKLKIFIDANRQTEKNQIALALLIILDGGIECLDVLHGNYQQLLYLFKTWIRSTHNDFWFIHCRV